MTVAAVITAAGSGTRLGALSPDGALPKALVPIEGRPLVAWAVAGLGDVADRIVVTAPPSHVEQVRSAVLAVRKDGVTVIAGGDTRQASVAAGLAELALAPDDIVLIHDAARAFQVPAVMAATVDAVRGGADGAVPVLPVVDTLIAAPASDGTIGDVVDREGLRAVQTPQTFRAQVAIDAHRRATADPAQPAATDDATLARALGYRIVAVDGHESGMKVTRPSDLPLARHLAQQATGPSEPVRASAAPGERS